MPKLHHKPMPLERNGCAMIVMHLDAVERGAILDLGLIRHNAQLTIQYLEALSKGECPPWHTLTACPGCGSRDGGRDKNGLCNECNAKNHVAGDNE